MGLIEWINGWERIENSKVDNKLIKSATKKSAKIFPKVAGNTFHRGFKYTTMRGGRMASHVPSFKFHIKGKNYIYRIKHLRCNAAEGNGHGFYTGGGLIFWRKLRSKNENRA